MCTMTGGATAVTRIAFSHDDAQVVCSSEGENLVRFFDVASGRRVRQRAGNEFALVEGLSGENTMDRHVITALNDTLRIYEMGNGEQHAGAAPVACFKAPHKIISVRCCGASICVACDWGAVYILSAPFLAA